MSDLLPWVQVDKEFLRYRSRKLAAILGCKRGRAIELYADLLDDATSRYRGGVYGSPEALGRACGFKDVELLVAGLIDVHCIEALDDGQVLVVGVKERYEKAVRKKALANARKKKEREAGLGAMDFGAGRGPHTGPGVGTGFEVKRADSREFGPIVTRDERPLRVERLEALDQLLLKQEQSGKFSVPPAPEAAAPSAQYEGGECVSCGTDEAIPCVRDCLLETPIEHLEAEEDSRDVAPIQLVSAPVEVEAPQDGEIAWTEALGVFEAEGKSYALKWLERLRPLQLIAGTLMLAVHGDVFFRDWVDDNYRQVLEDALARGGKAQRVGFQLVDTPLPKSAAEVEQERLEAEFQSRREGIRDRVTFLEAFKYLARAMERPCTISPNAVPKIGAFLHERLGDGSSLVFDVLASFFRATNYGDEWPLAVLLSGGPGNWKVFAHLERQLTGKKRSVSS